MTVLYVAILVFCAGSQAQSDSVKPGFYCGIVSVDSSQLLALDERRLKNYPGMPFYFIRDENDTLRVKVNGVVVRYVVNGPIFDLISSRNPVRLFWSDSREVCALNPYAGTVQTVLGPFGIEGDLRLKKIGSKIVMVSTTHSGVLKYQIIPRQDKYEFRALY